MKRGLGRIEGGNGIWEGGDERGWDGIGGGKREKEGIVCGG